jgi:hypothetical protein
MREVRPLRSPGITPLPRYYEPVRLPAEAAAWLWIPPRRCTRHLAGSPGVLHLSVDARPPQTPRTVRCVRVLVASAPVAGFSTFGRMATANGFTRPYQVRLRWARAFALVACERLARCFPQPDRSASRIQLPSRAGPELHAERAIHMADTSQSARKMRLTGAPKNVE